MHDNSSAKPLNLSKPVQTRDGRKARILCTDRKGHDWCIVALVSSRTGDESVCVYLPSGLSSKAGRRESSDLVNVPDCVYVLMARRSAEHREGSHLYYHTYSDQKRAEADQEFLRQKGYTLFNITELTIHI